MSLDERASLFKKQFPDAKLSGSKLWRIYRQNGIRYKFILTKKFVPPHRAFLIPEMSQKALEDLK